MNYGIFLFCVSSWHCYNSFRWFFLWSWGISSIAFINHHSSENLWGTLCWSLELSLDLAISSPVFCTVNPSLLILSIIPALVPKYRETARLHKDYLSWYCGLETLSRHEVRLITRLTSFVSFLLRIIKLYCLMSNVLKTIIFYILSAFYLL